MRRETAILEGGDLESWLKFFLRGLAETSNAAAETARRVVALREDHRTLILNRLGRKSGNGIALLETLFQAPMLDIKRARMKLGISYANANLLVSDMVKLEILQEMTGNARNRLFYYAPYIALFDHL